MEGAARLAVCVACMNYEILTRCHCDDVDEAGYTWTDEYGTCPFCDGEIYHCLVCNRFSAEICDSCVGEKAKLEPIE